MTAFRIDPTRITRVKNNNLTARISNGEIVIKRSRRNGDTRVPDNLVVSDLFGTDVWQMQHGYEVWLKHPNGKWSREVALVPLDQPAPDTPIDGHAIYTMPIYSAVWGGRAELVFDDKASSAALAAFCDEINTWPECHSADPVMIPHVEVTEIEQDEFGVRPVLAIAEWAERPRRWGALMIQPTRV
jgi:hypothetical protein